MPAFFANSTLKSMHVHVEGWKVNRATNLSATNRRQLGSQRVGCVFPIEKQSSIACVKDRFTAMEPTHTAGDVGSGPDSAWFSMGEEKQRDKFLSNSVSKNRKGGASLPLSCQS